jgi:hypothetical protein
MQLRFAVTDSETGNPENLTGYTIRFAARRAPGDAAVIESPTSASVVVTDAPGGIYTVTVAASVTLNLTGSYMWQSEVQLGGIVSTVARGYLAFLPSVVP